MLATALLMSVSVFSQDEKKFEITPAADLVSSYVWRGAYQTGVSIQPSLSLSYAGLSLTAWGSTAFSTTAKEFDLLQLFITNRGKVFSREALLETVWKYDYTGDARTVDVHIRRLREKIERNPAQPEFIFTKWGVGYYFTDKD